MGHTSDQEQSPVSGNEFRVAGGHVVVVAPDGVASGESGDLNFFELVQEVWREKLLVVGITAIFGISSIAYALLAREWYTADVLLVSAEDRLASGIAGTLAGQLGGLAGLAGVAVDAGSTVEPLAVLTSREFTRSFIEDEGLLNVLFEDDWDKQSLAWKMEDPEDWPDMQDAVRFFDEEVRAVDEDISTGLVTLSIQWTDADAAARWANLLVSRLNSQMRDRALRDAEINIEYLTDALHSTTVVALQQSISSLLETELQKLMLARGSEEFSFRVIDHAEAPKKRSKPNRPLVVMFAVLMGGVLSVLTVVVRQAARANANRVKPEA